MFIYVCTCIYIYVCMYGCVCVCLCGFCPPEALSVDGAGNVESEAPQEIMALVLS